MTLKTLTASVGAGVATFLLIGIAVTELTQPVIEFSLLVGLPAGLIAGVVAAGLVYAGLSEAAPTSRRRVATAFGSFGGVFLLILVLTTGVFNATVTLSLLVSVISGALAAGLIYVQKWQ